MTVFRAGSATDVGRVRSNNQDSLLVREGELFAVADGMGGHQGGEVASALALSILGEAHDDHTTSTLVRAVRSANQAVFDKAGSDPDLKGMGTTLTALADVDTAEGKRLAIVNVGDSRLYRFRTDALEQLTEDHSLVASLVRQGRITPEEAESHPQRNILTRALGIDEAVAVDSWEVEPVAGDRFLICSDGLFNEVDENKMVATLRRYDEPDQAAQELVRLANEGGGRDNITAVVVDVVSADDRDTLPTDGAPAAVPVPGTQTGAVEAKAPVTERHTAVPDLPYAGEDGDDAGGSAVGTQVEDDGEDEPRSRRFTWRVVVFVLALLVLAGVVVGALGWYARRTYFVTIDQEEVVIFKGRPGGFLWFDPTQEQRTGIALEDVPEGELDRLDDGVDQATLGDAENYVENLRDAIAADAEEDEPEEPEPEEPAPTSSTTTTAPKPDSGTGTGNRPDEDNENLPGNG